MILYVCGLIFSSDLQTIVLIKKNRPEWMKGMWNGVGGRIETGEDSVDTMRRECLEESGLDIPQHEWTKFCAMHWGEGRVDFYRTMNEEIAMSQTLTDEEIGIFPVNRLPRPIVYNLRWLIPLAKDRFTDHADIRLKPKKSPA